MTYCMSYLKYGEVQLEPYTTTFSIYLTSMCSRQYIPGQASSRHGFKIY